MVRSLISRYLKGCRPLPSAQCGKSLSVGVTFENLIARTGLRFMPAYKLLATPRLCGLYLTMLQDFPCTFALGAATLPHGTKNNKGAESQGEDHDRKTRVL